MRKITKVTEIFLFNILFLTFFSCSLKYGESVNTESVVPEFVFDNVELKEYEDKELKAKVNSEKLEQYKDSSETYAYKISFTAFDGVQNPETVGSCDYLAADTDKEVYTLYNNIEVESKKEKSKFFANMLRWNSKTQQLVSNRDDEVIVQKEDAVIKGKGFSASGITKTFRFTGLVSGDINTKKQNEENGGNTDVTDDGSSTENSDGNSAEKSAEKLIENGTEVDDSALTKNEPTAETSNEELINKQNDDNGETSGKDERLPLSENHDEGNIVDFSRKDSFSEVTFNADDSDSSEQKSVNTDNKKSSKSSKKKKSSRKRK